MADLLPNVQQQFFDNNGNPLASGKIYTYASGTTTPKATYTDTGAGTPNANPVILDANGRAAIWLSGAYKIVIATSADVVLRTVDAVQDYLTLITAAQTVASGAASTVQVTASDGTYGRLNTKLATTSGQGIGKSTLNPAGDEILTLALDINSMTEDTSPDFSADFVATYDASAATNKKVKLINATPFLDNYLGGLTLTTNVSDATNDIDVAAGVAADSENAVFMRLTAITKRIDAAWAVGTNQGGLDTGAVANGTYHIWLINRPDTNVTDILFSTSSTAPTMPTNYTKKRRIGTFHRTGAVNEAPFGINMFVSAKQTITAAGTLTIPHFLGVRPTLVSIELVNGTTQFNYSVGDIVDVPLIDSSGSASGIGASVVTDATNLTIRYGSAATSFIVLDKTSGAVQSITNASWSARFKAQL